MTLVTGMSLKFHLTPLKVKLAETPQELEKHDSLSSSAWFMDS